MFLRLNILLCFMNRGSLVYRQEKLASGWQIIHVLDAGTVVGRITRDTKKQLYRFFPGSENSVAFEFEHSDLASLKHLIETTQWKYGTWVPLNRGDL